MNAFLLAASALLLAGAPLRAEPAAAAPKAPAGPTAFSARAIYQRASPAVVLIMGFAPDGNGELGTGSLIDEQGHVLTNAHVVIRASTGRPFENLRVYLKPSRVTGDPKEDLVNPHTAKVAAYDRALDLALLAIEDPSRVPPIPLGDSAKIEAGEQVVAIGHPEQGGLWTLTQGVVSTVIANLGGVEGKNAFQTDASINRGNSGGPLLDREGSLIGVNTSMARKAADGLTITSVNFSVKAEVVKDWLAKSKTGITYSEVAPAPEQREEKPAPDYALKPAPAEAPAPKPAPKPEAQAVPARPAPAEKAEPKPAIVTPVKPYKIEDTLAREMAEMEDLEKEMQGEIEKRRGALGSP